MSYPGCYPGDSGEIPRSESARSPPRPCKDPGESPGEPWGTLLLLLLLLLGTTFENVRSSGFILYVVVAQC